MAALKLTAVGTSTGVVIPKETLNRMKVSRGDKLHAFETPDGYLLTPYDPAIGALPSLRWASYSPSMADGCAPHRPDGRPCS
jgi:bifunctional DNA-binding transcriptional regulator/antitoxin component of YhaV-PrlF toxin-antitoxin module